MKDIKAIRKELCPGSPSLDENLNKKVRVSAGWKGKFLGELINMSNSTVHVSANFNSI